MTAFEKIETAKTDQEPYSEAEIEQARQTHSLLVSKNFWAREDYQAYNRAMKILCHE